LHYLERLGQYLVYLGIPGVFLFSVLDSAGVPMFGGPDAVILLLAWRNPGQAVTIALAAAIGSLLGCLVLYRIGRAGGNLALARVAPERRQRITRMIEQHAAWACFLAVMSPPPLPTKPFLLAAGALRAPLGTFALAVFGGRVIRYSLVAWLGARFGSEAAQVMREHYLLMIAVLAGAAAAILVAKRFKGRRAQVRPAADSGGQPFS